MHRRIVPVLDSGLGADSLVAFTAKGDYLNSSATYVTMSM